MYKITRSFVIAVALLLTTVLIANAGGWAVITLDEWPSQIAAGQTLTIGFTVRQHGQTLRSDLTPIVRFDRTDAPGSFTVTATRQGAPGHYVAEVKFPSQGQWNWWVDIEQFGMLTQPLPPLSVQAAQPAIAPGAAVSSAPSSATTSSQSLAVQVLLHLLQRLRCSIIGLNQCSLGVLANDGATLPAAQSLQASSSVAAIVDQAALGQALFLAKGCAMCHAHDAIQMLDGPFSLGEIQPPDLSQKKYAADYVQTWLKNPQAIKPETKMPNLNLKSNEIDALVAFLEATSQ